MRMLSLPGVAKLGNRAFLADRDEDGVVAEALGSSRLLGDAAAQDPRPPHLHPRRRERDELADVASLACAAAHAVQLREQLRHPILAGAREPGRENAGATC